MIRALVLAERWDDLESLGPAMRTRWERLDPSAAMRATAHRASLLVTKVAEIVTRRGLAVALLAPDGAGKSTLADALTTALHFRARLFYLGLEGGRFAGSGPSRIRGLGILRRLVFLWRTWLAARYHQARRRFVIFDRYPYEALLATPGAASPLSVTRRRLLGYSLPAPDLVLVLDAPGEILHQRKAEHSPQRLERDRQEYLALARRLPRLAIVLDATRPFPEVRRDAVDAVWRTYRRRITPR
jgi:thymidylate kinase